MERRETLKCLLNKYFSEKMKLSYCGLIISIIHIVFSMLFETRIFIVGDLHDRALYWGLRVVSIIFVVYVWQKLFWLVNRGWKSAEVRGYVKTFCIVFMISLVLFIAVYPGSIYMDHVRIMYAAMELNVNCDMTFVLTYLYIFSYMLFPVIVAPVLMLMVIASLVCTHVIETTKILRGGRKTYWIYLLFLNPVILLAMVHPHRLQYYAWGYVFLLVDIFITFKKKECDIKRVIIWAVMTGFLAMFRVEGIYLLVVIPLILSITSRDIHLGKKKIILFIALMLFVFFALKGLEEYHENQISESYGDYRTAIITMVPLGKMLNEPEKYTFTEDMISIIEEVVDIEKLKESTYYNYRVEPYKDITRQAYNNYMKMYVRLIVSNIPEYLSIKWNTYRYASAMGELRIDYDSCRLIEKKMFEYADRFPEWTILNDGVRKNVLRLLEGHHEEDVQSGTIVYYVFYNVSIVIGMVFLCMFRQLKRKDLVSALITGIVLFHAALVFLTASCSRLKHYLPVYLLGSILIFFTLFEKKQESYNTRD